MQQANFIGKQASGKRADDVGRQAGFRRQAGVTLF
jgi:hypothetical protein